MKKTLLFIVCTFAVLGAFAQRKTCINSDWRFFYGNGKAAITYPAATNDWRVLTLPHDWSVETEAAKAAGGRVIGPFSSNSVGGFQTGNTVGGEGWYAKTLNVTEEDLEGRVSLYFEGAYYYSWVYVNGKVCNHNVYGYSSFKFDITDQLHVGENSVVVRVVNNGNNTRWYAGSGIFRDVWMIRTPKLHADEWDTFVMTEDNSRVTVSALIHNDADAAQKGRLAVKILDAEGDVVAEGNTSEKSVDAGTNVSVAVEMKVKNAKTWSPEHPNLYTAVISVKDDDGKVVDEFEKRFGFRTISFSATDGFRLNGEQTLLYGGCVHHDNGLLGAAAFDDAERRKVLLLKAQGYNALRCSHNIPSESFLDICDEVGMMVIDEAFDQWLLPKNNEDYHKYFATHSDQDLAVMVRRDRNHPSIIMWSIGNEIPGRIEPAGMEAAARLRAGVLKYDTTRPVTAAICGWDAGDAWNSAGNNWDAQCDNAFKSLDVGGYNYIFGLYESDHNKYPDRVMYGAETYPKQASENWNKVEALPYVIGDFVWTAMDYLGEAGIGCASETSAPSMFQGWPYFNGWCGDIDLIGQKKPQSYYRDVVWRQKPVTMAVQPTASFNNAWGWQLEYQSWTFPGREGQNVSVNVYSRAPRVRLYLNGVNKGEGVPGDTYWAGFSLPYEPGTLKVVNLDAAGNEIEGESFELKTTGQATDVRLVYEEESISAEENDLVYVTIELIDEEGNVVTSDCSTQICIKNTGCGELLACGTASPNDMKSFRSTTPTVYNGRALAILRSNGTAGPVSLEVEMMEPVPEPTSYFFKNMDFGKESHEDWVISDNNYIRYNGSAWKSTDMEGYLECYVGWGNASTLAGHAISQSSKVLPAGQYAVTFDYNGTIRVGGSQYSASGTMEGVEVSVGGQSLALKEISADTAQKGKLVFTLTEPKAVTFMVKFADNTNVDWFAFDNMDVEYTGSYKFEESYKDMTNSVPQFGGNNWVKQSHNASAGYTETKLTSDVYNMDGLAYWNGSAQQNTDLFVQTINNLPAGKYGVAAFAAANLWSGSDNDRNPQKGTYLFAKTSGGADAEEEVTTATYGLYSLVIDVKEGESLTLGLRAGAENGNNWCYLAEVTLVRLGNVGNDDTAINGVSTDDFSSADAPLYSLNGYSIDNPVTNQIYIANGKKYVKR